MMDFDEFKEKVKDNIKSYLPMQYEKQMCHFSQLLRTMMYSLQDL